MAKFESLKPFKILKERGDTNSKVELLKEENTDNLFVRKIIYGIEHPLYQAIFSRETRALYKLNSCSNVVKIFESKNMILNTTKEKVGCIYLEYIHGEPLSKVSISKLNSKEKFLILKQIINAVESAHSNGIIHRDINPNNIMITTDMDVKIIDFGICKIKEMINSATLFTLGTNLYSAPEVHIHSDSASEQSDLYSIGALTYYLFTSKQPPLSIDFSNTIDKTSGIDVDLKPIIKKMVMINPIDRYENIFELKKDLIQIFDRFLNSDLQMNLIMDVEKFLQLKKSNLIPNNIKIVDANQTYIKHNFIDLYAFKDENENYKFLGNDYSMDCIFDEDASVFRITNFIKMVPLVRENLKKRYATLNASIQIIDQKYLHRQRKNDSLQIKIIIDNYYDEYKSNNNVDVEYKAKYGSWRDLLNITKESINNGIVRLNYDKYSLTNDIIKFDLKKGVFIDAEGYTRDQVFVYEKHNNKKNKKTAITIGYYDDDYYDEDHIILSIKSNENRPQMTPNGEICLDYRRDLMNVQRQIDALDSIEKEDYSCSYNLKRIIAGVDTPINKVLEENIKFYNEDLDISQQDAVRKALHSDSLMIIQGPPGTGKTNVIIEIIQQILKSNRMNKDMPEKKILLVSQSHPAVDKMLSDLIEQSKSNPSLIRIGRDEKLNMEIKEKYSLTFVKEEWIDSVKYKCINYSEQLLNSINIDKEQFTNYFSEVEKKLIINQESNINEKLIFDVESKANTVIKQKNLKMLELQQQWIEHLPQCDEVELYLLKSTTIIAGTCTGFISNRVIKTADFDYLIIDEAAKATFPELAVSFNKANKIIMVGDHLQLPPVLDTEMINRNKSKLDISSLYEGIFKKLYDEFPESNKHRLTVQYRMHPAIGSLISQVFYDNEIQNGIEHYKRETGLELYNGIAIEWISTSSHPEKERYETIMGSHPKYTYKNSLEIRLISEKLYYLNSEVKRKTKVAIITAYSAQKYALASLIKQKVYKNLDIEVDTVDAFQGSQKEIIIYSTVRSSDKPKIGFLKSEARLNVAFSRAQSLLIIVGDSRFLENGSIPNNRFPEVLKYIRTNKYCRVTNE
jgi:superfamily I DNA and/or RNA helicase